MNQTHKKTTIKKPVALKCSNNENTHQKWLLPLHFTKSFKHENIDITFMDVFMQ